MSDIVKPISASVILAAGANSNVSQASYVWVGSPSAANISVWTGANTGNVTLSPLRGSIYVPAGDHVIILKAETDEIESDALIHVSSVEVRN